LAQAWLKQAMPCFVPAALGCLGDLAVAEWQWHVA